MSRQPPYIVKTSRDANPLEKAIYERVCFTYRAAGCEVYRLSQSRASNQSPGIPDLFVFHEDTNNRPGFFLTHEVKRPKGAKVSTHQRRWADLAEMVGVHHLIGGMDACEEALIEMGFGVRLASGLFMVVPKGRPE